jgi:hypothetical protein
MQGPQNVVGQGITTNAIQAAQSNYNPNLQNYQMQGPQDISTASATGDALLQYVNPYQQAVTGTAVREAQLQGDLAKQQGALGSIGRGTFGGARQALMQAEQQRGVNQQISDIKYKGAQDAYAQAQAQFNADQARKLQAATANQQTGLQTGQQNLQANLGVQQLGAQNSIEAQKANQAAGLQGAQLNQQGQQYAAGLGKDLGLAGLQAGMTGSQNLGALANTQQIADLQRLQAQATTGAEQQALAQKIADLQFQNAMAGRNYSKEQLQYYSDILRGNAGALGSTAVQYAPQPSAVSQLGGLGLGALGLSKAFS